VQPLEFERGFASQRLYRADGVGIVGGKGRVDAVAGRQQSLGAGEIANVGRDLAGEDRIIGKTGDLGDWILGTLDQPDIACGQPRQFDGPVENSALE
jgi:hypothetical protein